MINIKLHYQNVLIFITILLSANLSFASSSKLDSENIKINLMPFYKYKEDSSSSTKEIQILYPFFKQKTEGKDLKIFRIWPLLNKNDKIIDEFLDVFTLASILFVHGDSQKIFSIGLPYLLSYKKGDSYLYLFQDAKTFSLFTLPIFGFRKNSEKTEFNFLNLYHLPETVGTGVFPIFGYKDELKYLAFPFVWFSWGDKNDDKRFILFPIIWFNYFKRLEHFVFFPFVGIFPHSFDYDKSGFALFPFVWWAFDKKTGSGDDRDYNFHAFPFYGSWRGFSGKQQGYILFPFIWWNKHHDESFSLFIPFYMQKKDKNITKIFSSVPPAYMYDEKLNDGSKFLSYKYIFPSIWTERNYRRDYKTFHFIPFFGKWQKKDYSGWYFLFPMLYSNSIVSPEGIVKFTTKCYLSLLWYNKDHIDNKGYLHLIPFFGYWKKQNEYFGGYSLFPLCWWQKNYVSKKSFLYLLPFFGEWKEEGKYKSRFLTIPPVYYKDEYSSNTIIAKTRYIFPNILWQNNKEDGKKQLHIFPLYGSSHIDKEYGYKYFLFPIMWMINEYKNNNDIMLKRFLFIPILFTKKNYIDNTYYNHIFPLFGNWGKQNKNYISYILFPLFWFGENNIDDNNKKSTYSCLFPLIWWKKSKDESVNYFHIFPIYGSFKNGYSTEYYDAIKGHYFLYPLFFYKENEINKRNYESKEQKGHVSYRLLKSIEKTGIEKKLFSILLYSKSEYDNSNNKTKSFGAFLPFYWWNRDYITNKAKYYYWPLFSIAKTDGKSKLDTVGPFLWSIERNK